MKKFLSIIFTAFSILIVLTNTSFADRTIGKGEVKLDSLIVDYFIDYIRGGHAKSPELFVITNDGYNYAMWWWCSAGTSNCRSGSRQRDVEKCEQVSGFDCSVFAKRRTIVWKNGINKGGKQGKINSKWSDTEIIAKLTELGFLGETTSTEEKVSTTNKGNIVEQLEALTTLFKTGALTQQEYDEAKKKVLND